MCCKHGYEIAAFRVWWFHTWDYHNQTFKPACVAYGIAKFLGQAVQKLLYFPQSQGEFQPPSCWQETIIFSESLQQNMGLRSKSISYCFECLHYTWKKRWNKTEIEWNKSNTVWQQNPATIWPYIRMPLSKNIVHQGLRTLSRYLLTIRSEILNN